MDRLQLLDEVLRRLAALDASGALAVATSVPAGTDDVFAAVLAGLAAFMGDGAPEEHHPEPTDPATALLVGTMATLRESRGLPARSVDLIALAAVNDPGTPIGAFAHYLAIEAALTAARLDVAAALTTQDADAHARWSEHPYGAVMLACAARTAIFTGNITTGLALLAADAPAGPAGDLLRATKATAAGNAADASTMRALIDTVEASQVAPRDHIGRGIHLLLAFGVLALGDARGAVRHLLDAGGGAELERLTIIDRLLGYEVFVSAAVDEGDLGSAEAWQQRADLWAGHRAAAPTVHRIRSRVCLLRGDPDSAEEHAALAVAAAAGEGRAIERAEAEMVLARARIARRRVPDATRDLRTAVELGDVSGHHAVRLAAGRVLRPARRRLPPPAGGGATSLSVREREIAELILSGAGNAEIAARLCLSPATVRTHVTRVLTAYGVATRIGFLAAARPWPELPQCPPGLTSRQREVAELVAAGRSNPEIAATLGISAKSVERHVSEILLRWGLRNRFEIAHQWWSAQP